MDREFCVPLAVVAGFGKIRALTQDPALLIEAVHSSELLIYDDAGSRVGPRVKPADYCTVVVRNIAQAEEHTAVAKWLADCGAPPVVALTFDKEWNVLFESQAAALEALQTLHGKLYAGVFVYVLLRADIMGLYYANYLQRTALTQPNPYAAQYYPADTRQSRPVDDKRAQSYKRRGKAADTRPRRAPVELDRDTHFPPLQSSASEFIPEAPVILKSFSAVAAELKSGDFKKPAEKIDKASNPSTPEKPSKNIESPKGASTVRQ